MARSVSLLYLVLPAALVAAGFTAADAKDKEPGRPYEIRYTSGSVTNKGWEKALCEGDPNLKHWNWSAMTNYTQAYKRFAPGAFEPPGKRKSGGIYVKPIHLPPINNVRPPSPPVVVGNRTTNNLNGQVRVPKVSALLNAEEPKVLTYSNASGRLANPSRERLSEGMTVQGKVIK